MWITDLSNDRSTEILGEFAPEIIAFTAQLIDGASDTQKPASLDVVEFRDSLRSFGANGPSVTLFLKSWKGIEWGKREGQPHPRDREVTRVDHYTKALSPTTSPRWEQALRDAGYLGGDPLLSTVWEAAASVGAQVGGMHAGFLAGGATAELAQMPARDLHFFLDMMPWIRDGHWPCGWDDSHDRLKVF